MPLDSLTYSPTPVALDADGEILMRAAAYLERNGWLQERWGHEKNGPRCLLGAIAAVTETRYVSSRDRLGDGPRTLIAWNNDPARTKAEVVSRLRAAAQGVGR